MSQTNSLRDKYRTHVLLDCCKNNRYDNWLIRNFAKKQPMQPNCTTEAFAQAHRYSLQNGSHPHKLCEWEIIPDLNPSCQGENTRLQIVPTNLACKSEITEFIWNFCCNWVGNCEAVRGKGTSHYAERNGKIRKLPRYPTPINSDGLSRDPIRGFRSQE